MQTRNSLTQYFKKIRAHILVFLARRNDKKQEIGRTWIKRTVQIIADR